MAAPNTNPGFPTAIQTAEKAILDYYNKQTYLGNQYIFSINQTLGSATETLFYLLQNPASSKKSLFQNWKKLTCLSSNNVIFRIYLNPAVTSTTTASTPVNMRTGSTNTSIAGVFNASNFSVSSNGSYIASLVSANYVPDISTVMEVIDPGTSMLITVQSNEPSGIPITGEILWYEL